MNYQRLHILPYFFTLLFALPSFKAKAQNVTSPYSILGIGDIDTKEYGRYFISGSSALARRDPLSYNYTNPASLTSLPYKMMNFDVSMRGRVSDFTIPGPDTSTAVSKDFAVKRVAMAFKVSYKTGIAFGLRPFSSVNYQYNNSQQVISGNNYLIRSIDGSGGINQVYFSIGKSLGKSPDSSRVSVGITAAYLFGSLQRTTTYSGSSLLFSITKQETNFLYGGNFQFGFQYSSERNIDKLNKTQPKWKHRVGLVATINTNLGGQLTTDYTDNENTALVPVPEKVANSQFKLPASVGLGYSATNRDQLTFSVDANYSNWQNQALDYANSHTTSTFRISGGIEYSILKNTPTGKFEKGFLGVGFSAENSYVMLNNNYLRDYAISLGGGYNATQRFSFYGGLETGIKGSVKYGQIKENYVSFVVGITLKDYWYGTKKLGRFY